MRESRSAINLQSLIDQKDSGPLADVSRRAFIRKNFSYYAALLAAPYLSGCSDSGNSLSNDTGSNPSMVSNLTNLGPLLEVDENGCRLPEGFSCRVIASSSSPVVDGSAFLWHGAPDGGACFSDGDGWIYVSNSELFNGDGGVSAIKFSPSGDIIDAYPILSGTTRNCVGGETPWGTWLSCEESGDNGRVFECDPKGIEEAIERPALGYFSHEAVAYDLDNHTLYLTEDRPDSRFYRFTPARLTAQGFADLSEGILEVAEVIASNGQDSVIWHEVTDPQGLMMPTRQQVAESSAFDGGEGIIYFDGLVSFTTKGDNRVWTYNVAAASLSITYDEQTSENPILSGVDNITVNFAGEYLVAEDGGDMQILVLTADGDLFPLVELADQPLSEICGPAFSPDGTRLYFSSQRGPTGHFFDGGITYEMTGPFFSRG